MKFIELFNLLLRRIATAQTCTNLFSLFLANGWVEIFRSITLAAESILRRVLGQPHQISIAGDAHPL